MKPIIALSKIFARYKIYPIDKYISQSPVRHFQHIYPENYFSSQIEIFLRGHIYKPVQRGADLPWWGFEYFTNKSDRRVMVISQDSLAGDAGSIVFWACLYSVLNPKDEYRKFIQELGFAFKGWETMWKQLCDWKIDLSFCYVTDASKVYKKNSWEDKDFDKQKSKELLEAEIEFCNPDLIILLGAKPLYLLDRTKNYTFVVESGNPLLIKGKKCVVAPFLIGNGPVGNRHGMGFKKRLEIASDLIVSMLSRV